MAETGYRYLVNLPGVHGGTTILMQNGAPNVDDVIYRFPDLPRAQVYECLAYSMITKAKSIR